MTTTTLQTFDAVPAGSAPVSANTSSTGPACSAVTGTGSTVLGTTANKISGTASLEGSTPSGASTIAAAGFENCTTTSTKFSACVTLQFDAAPVVTGFVIVHELRLSSGRAATAWINSSGLVKFSAQSTDIVTGQPTANLTFPCTVVFDLYADSGTSTTDGRVSGAIINPVTGAFLGGMTGYAELTGTNTGAGLNFANIQFGKPSSENVTGPFVWRGDNLRTNDDYVPSFTPSGVTTPAGHIAFAGVAPVVTSQIVTSGGAPGNIAFRGVAPASITTGGSGGSGKTVSPPAGRIVFAGVAPTNIIAGQQTSPATEIIFAVTGEPYTTIFGVGAPGR